jgi:hypothetical protein
MAIEHTVFSSPMTIDLSLALPHHVGSEPAGFGAPQALQIVRPRLDLGALATAQSGVSSPLSRGTVGGTGGGASPLSVNSLSPHHPIPTQSQRMMKFGASSPTAFEQQWTQHQKHDISTTHLQHQQHQHAASQSQPQHYAAAAPHTSATSPRADRPGHRHHAVASTRAALPSPALRKSGSEVALGVAESLANAAHTDLQVGWI